ncbi:MAG: hypothetical protein GU347_02775 [Desulfurococcales archaeon]|jgi:predicted type IV restriction endonuclease|nr:hypothetical protein [Desulfurococcales archaeon]
MVYSYVEDFVKRLSKLKERIEKHRDLFSNNEAAVRYAIVNPFLQMLGWNIDDPEEVIPEYPVEEWRADYALSIKELVGGKPIAFIEVKKLGNITDKESKEKLKYAFVSGVKYTIMTDGDKWFLYDAFKEAPLDQRIIASWSILNDDPFEIAFKSLVIAKTRLFGKEKPNEPLFKPAELQTGKSDRETASMKPRFDKKTAEMLILKILADSKEPVRRRDIVNKTGSLVQLNEEDLKPWSSKYNIPRWKVIADRLIDDLRHKGLLKTVDLGYYVITEEGRKRLEQLEKK